MLTSMTPGSGVTLKLMQARIGAGRRIAFDEHRLAELLGGVLDRGDEVEIVLGALGRRHEDEEMAVARLEGDGGAHDVAGRVADAGPQPEIGRQRAPPGLAARCRRRRWCRPAGRAPGGAAPARGGRRRAAAGRDAAPSDRARRRSPCPPAPPTAANRAAGGSRAANRPGSGSTSPSAGTTARCASGRGRYARAGWEARCRRRFRGPSRTPAPAARAPSGPSPWRRRP